VKQQWETISAKVMAMSQRERLMILGALLTLIWLAFDTMLFTPSLQKQKLYRQEISAKQEEVAQMQAQQATIIQAGKNDPDAGRKVHLALLQQKVAQMDEMLRTTQSELVPPDHMSKVLENLLQRDRQIKLVSLATLPVSGLMDGIAGNKEKAAPALGIYKHGFELTLEGNYLDMMRYVTELEASPWRMLWGDMSLQAGEYPRSSLKLTLYTLSLDQAWLSI
jgi:MSHA biogenesis protein MshJ